MYNQKVLDYYQRFEKLEPLWKISEAEFIAVTVGDLSAGERVIFQAKLNSEGLPCESRFQVLGCGYMIALVIWLNEKISLGYFAELKNISIQDLVYLFELPAKKTHSAVCLLEVIQKLSALCKG